MAKNRNLFWDNFKGILIMLVVFGHFIDAYATKMTNSFVNDVYVFIYSFHMPAFIFCSGYFSKSERSRSMESLTKLFLYYLVFNTSMLLFAYFYLGTDIELFKPYYSYWYLISLITWRALIGKLSKIKGIVAVSVIIALLSGFSEEFVELLSVRRTVAFFPFFAAGYLLDTQKVDRFLSRRKTPYMVLSFFLVLIAAAAAFLAVTHWNISVGTTLMVPYGGSNTVLRRILVFTISAAAIVGMFLFIPNRKLPLLSKIGKNSLLIYLAHRVVTIVYSCEFFPLQTYTHAYILYAFIATIMLCIILSSERLSRVITAACDKAAAALTSPDDKSGATIITAMVLVFLCLLLLNMISGIA